MKTVILPLIKLLPTPIASVSEDIWVLIPNWIWMVLISASFLSVVTFPLLKVALRKLKKFFRRPKDLPDYGQKFIDAVTEYPLEGPLTWIILSVCWLGLIRSLELPPTGEHFLNNVTSLVLSINVIRLVYDLVDATGIALAAAARKTTTTLDDQLVPLGTKTAKILVVLLGALSILQNFGFNVASVLAGLGLGGLALALAAQDTAANVFGSIMILMDQPFKVGDWIKVDGSEGTVEEIGFRSTRIRTFYNSLITIPNSVVAKEQVDNMGVRPRRRVRQVLGLTYETPTEKIKEFCDRVRYALKQQQHVDQDGLTVTFQNFSAASLDVLVQFHLLHIEKVDQEQAVTETIFLEFVEIAKEIGVDFAYPTQTLYLERAKK